MRFGAAEISGTGGFLPGEPVTNKQLIVDCGLNTTSEWIQENLGIVSRHFAPEEMATSDLAVRAGQMALEDSQISPKELDRILVCTTSPDWLSPACASKVQYLLGANCPAEDKNSACAGFLFGLDHGLRLLATGMKHVLVIGSDVKSRFVKKDDLRLAPIFADGAGAFVLSRIDSDSGFLSIELWTSGEEYSNLLTPAGGSALPASLESVKKNLHSVTMQVEGRRIFDDAVLQMTRLSKLACEKAGIRIEDVDVMIPHQANLSIIRKIVSNLNFPMDKVVVTIEKTGNIVTGTLPYSYHEAIKRNFLQKGQTVLFVTAGAGYSGGAAVYKVP